MLYIPYHTHCRLTDVTDLTDKGIYNEDTSIFFLVEGWLLRNLRSSRKIEYITNLYFLSHQRVDCTDFTDLAEK